MALNKERGIYPAIGKATFSDLEAFTTWYIDQEGYNWLSGEAFKNLIYERQTLIGDMAPNYHSMYGSRSDSVRWSKLLRTIQDYLTQIGGQYDLLLHEPELSIIQFGEHRLIIPTRFLCIERYRDQSEATLEQLNHMLLTGESTSAQSGELTQFSSLTLSNVRYEMDEQQEKIAAAQQQIEEIKKEQERELERVRRQYQTEMLKVERMKLGLQATVEELNSKIFILESTIYAVECYLGETIEFIQLRQGAAAPVEMPLVIHQKLRYLDEELPILVSIYNFEFDDREMFETALKHREDLMEHFCPGDKCVSFIRVSKTGTAYGINEYDVLDKYEMLHGKTIGILLRNGENLYYGWTDEARVILPDGNAFYTPKNIQMHHDDPEMPSDNVDYPSSRYSDEQIDNMIAEEKEELLNKDRIAFHKHQRGFQKRQVLSRFFIFSMIQGLLDNGNLVSIPEKVNLLKQSGGSRYITFSNADGWLEDNRYGNFSDILRRFDRNHKVGDMILSTIGLHDGYYKSAYRNVTFERSVDGSSRTHDCHLNGGEIYELNVKREHSQYSQKGGRTAYYVSLKKEYSLYGARSNFEVWSDEFINLTFLNSEWLHYAILNKKIGTFMINGTSVSYAHAVKYLKLAYQYLTEREANESKLIGEYISDLADRYPTWMVKLSDWKEMKDVRKITQYQAKRFAKWLLQTEEECEG